MINYEFEVVFYDEPDGTEPANIFLKHLDNKMRAKLIWTIALLRSFGTELREPYSKHLNDGIFELRVQVGSDISRVLYFFIIGRCVVLTHGFIKKTNKTPQFEIERAKKYRQEYLDREENNK